MRKREMELITALAEGRLDDETEARRLIASSPELMAEYEAQKTAISALADTPTAQMTESERTDLRRGLWTQLRSDPVGAKPSRLRSYRWAMATAAVIVVVGVAGVLNGIQQTSDGLADSAQDEAFSTTLASGLERNLDAAEEQAAAAPSAELAPSPQFEAIAGEIREGSGETYAFTAADSAESDLQTRAQCSTEEADWVIGRVEVDEGSYLIVLVGSNRPGADTPVSFIDETTCEVAYVSDPPDGE